MNSKIDFQSFFFSLQKLANDPEYEKDVIFASVDVDEANVQYPDQDLTYFKIYP